jgi:hypothetical protein
MKPISEFPAFTEDQRMVLGWLSSATLRTSGSALALVELGRIWDAEILARSAFEGSLKFCHLLSNKTQYDDRFIGYEQHLPAINSLGDHTKLERLIAESPTDDESLLKLLRELLFTNGEREEIGKRYPKKERLRLQSIWGYTGLVEQMINSEEGMRHLAKGLLH